MKTSVLLAELRAIRDIAIAADRASFVRADEDVARMPADYSGIVKYATHNGTRIGVLLAKHQHVASRLEALIDGMRPRAGARR